MNTFDAEVSLTVGRDDGNEGSPLWHHAARLRRAAMRILLGMALLGLWEAVSGRLINPFWISTPSAIALRLIRWVGDGSLQYHLGITVREATGGFVLGGVAGIVLGLILGRSAFVGDIAEPYIVALYGLPKVALAPLFILWFGISIAAKVAFSAVIVFFLVFFSTFAASREVDRDLIHVVLLMGGRPGDVFLKVVLPTTLTWIFVGLKLAVPQALIGAVVGEIVASNKGLGYLIEAGAGQFDTTGVFAALFVLMVISALLHGLLGRAEKHVFRWKAAAQSQ